MNDEQEDLDNDLRFLNYNVWGIKFKYDYSLF